MTAFPSPNMMMRRRKTEHEIRQEVVQDMHRGMWAPTWEDIERVTTERILRMGLDRIAKEPEAEK